MARRALRLLWLLAAVALLAPLGPAPVAHAVEFSNKGLIDIPEKDPYEDPSNHTLSYARANPYPSEIPVQGQLGGIHKVTVTLYGFSHRCAKEVRILLVGPVLPNSGVGGRAAALMGNTGGCAEVDGLSEQENTPVDLTFDDDAPQQIPQVPSDAKKEDKKLKAGTYKPTFNAAAVSFPSAPSGGKHPPATPGEYPKTLSTFYGANPFGFWRLYVYDTVGDWPGSIAKGWCLRINNGHEWTTCSGVSGGPGTGPGPNPGQDLKLSISNVQVSEGNSGDKFGHFKVTMSGPLPDPSKNEPAVEVSVKFSDGTAKRGKDYFATDTKEGVQVPLLFFKQQPSRLIPFKIRGDKVKEPDETFTVTLTSTTHPSVTGQAKATILDDESPRCAGRQATIVAKPGVDTIGTDGDDVIVGTNGHDTIHGKGGHDTICGLDGADHIYGGDGIDFIYGGPGIDTIWGGAGRNFLFGEEGNDRLYGEGSETQFIRGGEGDDLIFGGDGNDSLSGGEGNDTLNGGKGNDGMNGGLGNDKCTGGSGTDTAADCETKSSVP